MFSTTPQHMLINHQLNMQIWFRSEIQNKKTTSTVLQHKQEARVKTYFQSSLVSAIYFRILMNTPYLMQIQSVSSLESFFKQMLKFVQHLHCFSAHLKVCYTYLFSKFSTMLFFFPSYPFPFFILYVPFQTGVLQIEIDHFLCSVAGTSGIEISGMGKLHDFLHSC